MQEIKHISEETLIAIKENRILPEQYLQVLEHTCQCTGCADRLTSAMEEQMEAAIVQPPMYLADEIRERTKRADVQAVVVVKQTSKRMQLFLYSLRVGAAVLASIIILAVTAKISWTDLADQIPDIKQEESFFEKISEAKDSLSEKVNEFTNQLFQGGNKK